MIHVERLAIGLQELLCEGRSVIPKIQYQNAEWLQNNKAKPILFSKINSKNRVLFLRFVDVRICCSDHSPSDGLGAHRAMLAAASPRLLGPWLQSEECDDEMVSKHRVFPLSCSFLIAPYIENTIDAPVPGLSPPS